jgi:hypothetical protein
MRRLILFICVLLVALPALAQDPSPAPVTPAVIPADLVTPLPSATAAIPFNATSAAIPATLPAEDARLANCAAPTLPGFVPYRRAASVPIADLLIGSTAFTPTQIAALNCVDDTVYQPFWGVLWLPQDAFLVSQESIPIPETEMTDEAQLLNYEASRGSNGIPNQAGVTFDWESDGAWVTFSVCALSAYPSPNIDQNCITPLTDGQPTRFPASGSLDLRDFWRPGSFNFILRVYNSLGQMGDEAEISLDVVCSQDSVAYTPSLCPEAPPLVVGGAYQRFEHGSMVWFSDTQQILVLTSDGIARHFEDTFQEGMSNPSAVAPEGLFTPTRGFGRIWEALGGAEGSGLGWARAPEVGADVFRQPAGRNSYTTYVAVPDVLGDFSFWAVTQIPGQSTGYFTGAIG